VQGTRDVAGRHDRLFVVAAAVVMLFGIALRVRALRAGGQMFYDEVNLSLNVLVRPAWELWFPLDLAQTAPPLFLLVVKAVTRWAAASPEALRAVPLLAGCGLLPALWHLSRRLLEPDEALLALSLVALSPLHVFYASFVKPYTGDALVTVVLVASAAAALRAPTVRRLALLGALGLLSIPLSSTSIFTLAGAGASVLLLAWRRRSTSIAATAAGFVLVWGALMLVLLHTTYATLEDPATPIARFMRFFWARYFLYLSWAWGLPSLHRVSSSILENAFVSPPFADEVGLSTILLGLLAVVGLIACIRRDRAVGVLLAVPLGALYAACALQRYPMGARVTLFVTPLVALTIAAGTGTLLRQLPRAARTAVVLVIVGVGLAGMTGPLLHPVRPSREAMTRDLVATIRASLREPDGIYLRPGVIAPWLYYSTNWRRPDTALARRMMKVVDITGPEPVHDPWQEVLATLPSASDTDLTFPWDGRTLMIGRVMGAAGLRRPRPYGPWAEREATRIGQAGSCTVVGLVGNADARLESHALAIALRSHGGSVSGARYGGGFISFRACFPAR